MKTKIPRQTRSTLALLALAAAALPPASDAAQAPAALTPPASKIAEPYLAATPQALLGRKQKGQGFPDFGFMVSQEEYIAKWSDQPIFRLKTDFPTRRPSDVPEFLKKIDFKKDPLAYINAVRDYSFEGNLPDWDPHKNRIRGWYHIPWLHPTSPVYPPNGGTEGFHGLIKEAPLSPLQLGPDQKGKVGNYSVYAITLVNEHAGYSMGKMWADPLNPDPKVLDKRWKVDGLPGGFPVGTVFAKLLFTDAPQGTDKVANLVNPLTWKAYITENFETSSTRTVGEVHLLQMDIAVRDARAEGPGMTGWVFGTFVYNGALNKENKFMNLVPVGLMWGNDPDDKTNKTDPFPVTKTIVNPKLKQTVIFDGPNLPPQHLGWNGRLNGPADLNTTSCMSCHIAAQYPQVSPLVPVGAVPDGGKTPPKEGGSVDWMKSFQNIECATSMDPRTYSMDFSFQVAISLQNFFNVKSAVVQGAWASDYSLPPHAIGRR